jgi:hypothetical protein
MRVPRALSLLPLIVLLVISGSVVDAGARAPRPPGIGVTVVRPKWHRVASDVESVAQGGRYLALFSLEATVTLFDEQTKVFEPLTAPGCNGVRSAVFGGPWLAFDCGSPDDLSQVDLYDLAAGTWTEASLGPGVCNETISCGVDGVGTTWIRFETSDGSGHPSYTPYLQNIATGAVEPDPAPGHFYVQDDLDTATGVGAPCVTLRTPALDAAYLAGPSAGFPYWHQFGQYVLTTGSVPVEQGNGTPDDLYTCGSGLLLHLPYNSFVSTQAVVHQNMFGAVYPPLFGRVLPTLKSFTVPRPKGTLVALSNRTLYTIARGPSLWAAGLPRP